MLSRERQAMAAAARIYRQKSQSQEAMLRTMVVELLRMGGLYVKFAQLLLLNPMFFKAIPPELRRQVFDRVSIQLRRLEDYCTPRDLQFLRHYMTEIAAEPAYAGSFAAVFNARLKSGEAVIIKILRPELRQNLRRDLRLLGTVARPLSFLNAELKTALLATLKGFRAATLAETDYQAEVRNVSLLEYTFKDDPHVVIPKTYENLCTKFWIVQQKMHGVWLSEILEAGLQGEAALQYARDRTGSDLRVQLYELGKSSLYHALLGKPVHGDPHPGNVVLLPEDKIGLIDFGLVGMPITNRLALFEYVKEQIRQREGDNNVPRLIMTVIRFHANYLYRAMGAISELYNRPLLQEIEALLGREFFGPTGHQVDEELIKRGSYGDALSSSLNQNNRFGITIKLDNPLTQKAFMSLWRTNEELGLSDLITDIFKDTVTAIEQTGQSYTWREQPMAPDQALQIIAEWLATVSEKDPELFVRLQTLFTRQPASPGP